MNEWLRKSMYRTLKDGEYFAQLTTSVGVEPPDCSCQVSLNGKVFSSCKRASWQDGETWVKNTIQEHKNSLICKA